MDYVKSLAGKKNRKGQKKEEGLIAQARLRKRSDGASLMKEEGASLLKDKGASLMKGGRL